MDPQFLEWVSSATVIVIIYIERHMIFGIQQDHGGVPKLNCSQQAL